MKSNKKLKDIIIAIHGHIIPTYTLYYSIALILIKLTYHKELKCVDYIPRDMIRLEEIELDDSVSYQQNQSEHPPKNAKVCNIHHVILPELRITESQKN